MFDRLNSAATIVLLAPAIFAVWIAIRRSAPTPSPTPALRSTIIGQSQAATAVAGKPGVILKIEPASRALSA